MGTITRNFANNIVTGGKVDGTDGLTGTIPASNVANDTLGNLTAFPATVGDFVEVTASDVPASPSTAGQLFYNSTSGTLKGISLAPGTWASGGTMPTATYAMAAFGSQTSAVSAAGVNPSNLVMATTQEYNGTSWSNGTNYPRGIQNISGFGATETTGVAFGGQIPTNNQPTFTWYQDTYEYDGSTWTNTGNYPQTIGNHGSSGIQTAGLGAGGTNTAPGGPGLTGLSAEYDGSTWTAGNSISTAAGYLNRMYGTQTSSIAIFSESPNNNVESYNGTSWTAINALSTTRTSGVTAFGANDSEGIAAGNYPNGTDTESYDGTSWTTTSSISVGRADMGRGGNDTAGIVFGGGNNPPNRSETEEWTGPAGAITTVTTS